VLCGPVCILQPYFELQIDLTMTETMLALKPLQNLTVRGEPAARLSQ
jgi:hypothetical protein